MPNVRPHTALTCCLLLAASSARAGRPVGAAEPKRAIRAPGKGLAGERQLYLAHLKPAYDLPTRVAEKHSLPWPVLMTSTRLLTNVLDGFTGGSSYRSMRGHEGIDIKAAPGTPVRAIADGIVVWSAAEDRKGRLSEMMIRGETGLYLLYLHLDSRTLPHWVELGRGDFGNPVGTKVKAGQIIGRVAEFPFKTGHWQLPAKYPTDLRAAVLGDYHHVHVEARYEDRWYPLAQSMPLVNLLQLLQRLYP